MHLGMQTAIARITQPYQNIVMCIEYNTDLTYNGKISNDPDFHRDVIGKLYTNTYMGQGDVSKFSDLTLHEWYYYMIPDHIPSDPEDVTYLFSESPCAYTLPFVYKNLMLGQTGGMTEVAYRKLELYLMTPYELSEVTKLNNGFYIHFKMFQISELYDEYKLPIYYKDFFKGEYLSLAPNTLGGIAEKSQYVVCGSWLMSLWDMFNMRSPKQPISMPMLPVLTMPEKKIVFGGKTIYLKLYLCYIADNYLN